MATETRCHLCASYAWNILIVDLDAFSAAFAEHSRFLSHDHTIYHPNLPYPPRRCFQSGSTATSPSMLSQPAAITSLTSWITPGVHFSRFPSPPLKLPPPPMPTAHIC